MGGRHTRIPAHDVSLIPIILIAFDDETRDDRLDDRSSGQMTGCQGIRVINFSREDKNHFR